MKKHVKHLSMSALLMTTALLTAPHLKAQDNGPLIVELINRIGAVEQENRDLHGMLEENKHEISQLKQRVETLSSDVDYRLNTASTDITPHSNASPNITPHSDNQPIPLGRGKEIETPAMSSAAGGDYEKARALLEQGDYEAAEGAFASFVNAHPKDEQAGAAQYWLGVTYFVRGQHEKAAKAFAKGYKNYPTSSKAPDNLLKLAKSLAAIDRNADACATLDQLSDEHPKALTKEVVQEKRNLSCKVK